MRALAEGDVGWVGVRFRPGRGRGKLGVGWGLLVYLGRSLRKGLRLGFGIWAGINLFWAMAPVRALAEGGGGRFGVGFEHGRGRGEGWGG